MGCTPSTAAAGATNVAVASNVTASKNEEQAGAPVQQTSTLLVTEEGAALAQSGIAAAEALQESALGLTNLDADAESLGTEAITVLECVDKGIASVMELLGQTRRSEHIDVQRIQLNQRTPVERGLAKYSALGQVLIDLSSMALEGLPFGAPAAAALGALYGRASQAAKNSENCCALLKLLKSCDAQLARVAHRTSVPLEVQGGLLELTQSIVEGAQLMQAYTEHGFIVRTIASTSHTQQFQRIDQHVRGAMQKVSFAMSMELLAANYQDESAHLRAMVCRAAGLPENKSQEALKVLSSEQPKLLRSLLEQHGNYSSKVITSELSAMGVRVDILEGRMDHYMKSTHDNIQDLHEDFRGCLYLILKMNEDDKEHSSGYLAEYLRTWWDGNIKRRGDRTEAAKFIAGLLKFCEQQGWMPELLSIEEELEEDRDLLDTIAAASRSVRTTYDGSKQAAFLDLVVMPLLDRNKDGIITKSELQLLQMHGELFAARVQMGRPNSWMDLLNAIFKGVDASGVALRLGLNPEYNEAVAEVINALQVTGIVESYGVEAMLHEFVEGTRDWMYAEVQAWLDDKLGLDVSKNRRMFLLLAGPGMGKSLFSARMQTKLENMFFFDRTLVQVQHFFKVGEQRSQGKAMVLCLAHQMAQQLPGFAEKLLEVTKEHQAASLSVTETFHEFLLGPLQELDCESEHKKHIVVILLDALDEASDGNRDWRAVAALISKEFIRLPTWVKIIMTGRPQAEGAFVGWDPVWIRPEHKENMKDLEMLLVERLKQRKVVLPGHRQDAAQVILSKSQGEFVYAKYAFHELASKKGYWTPEDLEHALPVGLSGMFRHKLRFLLDSLHEERPDLLHLLRRQLLPILVASKELLSPSQCAIVTGAEVAQIDELLALLEPFYFVRLGGAEDEGSPLIHTYHKSVRDWLVGEGDHNTAGLQFAVDAKLGHLRLGLACFKSITEGAQPGSGQEDLGGFVSSRAAILKYALRYGVVHLREAGSDVRLDDLVLRFEELWQRAYAAGFGPEVLKDLSACGQRASPVVKDVVRWLRIVNNYLTEFSKRHPLAALQLAHDAPRKTIVAQHAAKCARKPLALLVTKEDNWTACLSTLQGHRDAVTGMAFSKDGSTIASSSDDKTVRIWEFSSGQLLETLDIGEPVVCVAISSDNKLCVTGSTSATCKVWHIASGQLKLTLAGHTGITKCLTFSADDTRIITGSTDGKIKIWDSDGAQLETLDCETDDVNSLVVSQDGATLLAACDDLKLMVWDLRDGRIIRTLCGHEGAVLCAAISRKSNTCVSGSMDTTIRIWDLVKGKLLGTLEGHEDAVECVSIVEHDTRSPQVVSGAWDHMIRVWDLTTKQCRAVLEGHSNRISSLSVSSDGSTLCSASWDKSIRVWDLQSEHITSSLEGHAGSLEKTTVNGNICLSCSKDKTAKIWDLVQGSLKATLHGHSDYVTNAALSPDNATCITVAFWSDDPSDYVRVWDMDSAKQKAFFEKGSEEASAHLDLLDLWNKGAELATGAGDMTFSMDASNSIIQMGESGDQCIYLMPPTLSKKFTKLMYEHTSHTVSFFSERGTFMRYKIL